MLEQASIIREKRKTIKITISNDGILTIFCPVGLSYARLEKIISSKENSINKRLNKTKLLNDKYNNIINYKSIILFGREYPIVISNKLKKPCFTEENFVITQKILDGDKLNFYIKKNIKEIAERVITQRIKDILQNYQKFSVSKIIIGNFKAKWGSCDNFKTLKFNWRLAMLSPKIVDFVIFHELTHLIELNHSKRFYQELESICPTWKESRLQLKDFSFLLSMYS